MIMRKSAHKDVDNPAGQVTFGFDRYPYLPKKLGDIIDRVNKQENIKQYRHKDFEDYWYKHHPNYWEYDPVLEKSFRQVFEAAREMV